MATTNYISQVLLGTTIREFLERMRRRRQSHQEKKQQQQQQRTLTKDNDDDATGDSGGVDKNVDKETRTSRHRMTASVESQHYDVSAIEVNDERGFQATIRSLFQQSNPHSKSRAAPTLLQNIHQREEWDCGVACLQIVLRWLRGGEDENGSATEETRSSSSTAAEAPFELTLAEQEERDFMLEFLATESIWTVELILLLENILSKTEANTEDRRLASYLMFSKKLEVDSEHSRLGYYERAFSDDSVRVQSRFEEARQANLPMLSVCDLSWDTMLELISREDCIAIMLLDGSILRDEELKAYSGHYVVLTGVTYDTSCVRKASSDSETPTKDYCMVVKNPSSHNETDYISPSKLERAWRAKGTDDDIVLIAKHQKQRVSR